MPTNEKRNSNIELLRIVCILFIISFHYVFKGGFIYETFCLNKYIVKVFWMFGELGVNCFMLITGYFMIQKNFKFKKMILLWSEIEFYNILILLVERKLNLSPWTGIKNFILELFPVFRDKWWFATVYLIIYLFSPFLSKSAKCMTKREYIKFLLLCLILWSIIPSGLGIFYNTTEGFLYYTRLLWLIIIWFTGAFIRLYGTLFIHHIKFWRYVLFIISLFIFSSILFIEKFNLFFAWLGTTEIAYFWRPNTVPMYILSISLFVLFINMKLPYLKLINKIASTTLGIYLLHDSKLSGYLWNNIFKNSTHMYSPFLILHILFATVIIFLCGAGLDITRQCLEKLTVVKWLDVFHQKWLPVIYCKFSKILDLFEYY